MKKIFLLLLCLSFFFCLSGCMDYRGNYDELYDKYLDLKIYYEETHDRYEEMDQWYDQYLDAIQKCEDHLTILSCYFDADEWPDINKATFDEAYDAYEELSSILRPFF